jgi:chromosome segregation ATPase
MTPDEQMQAVCGKRCDHGSECLRRPHTDSCHETQHGCVFYDASVAERDAEVERLREQHNDAQKTVDELLTSRNTLLAEVERLRAENEAYQIREELAVIEVEKDLPRLKDRLAKLEAENAELTVQVRELNEANIDDMAPLKSKVAELEAENAELEARVETLLASETDLATANEALKARLAWFEKYRTMATVIIARYELGGRSNVEEAIEDLQSWEQGNPAPKPEEG